VNVHDQNMLIIYEWHSRLLICALYEWVFSWITQGNVILLALMWYHVW